MVGRVCVLQCLCGRLSLHLLIADSSTHFFTTDSFDGRSCVQDGQWYQQNLVEGVVHRFVVKVVVKSVCVLAKNCRYYSTTGGWGLGFDDYGIWTRRSFCSLGYVSCISLRVGRNVLFVFSWPNNPSLLQDSEFLLIFIATTEWRY